MKERTLVLESSRLLLRPFEAGDAEDMLQMLYNDEIKKTYMIPDFESREKAMALFERYRGLSLDPARIVYGIYRKDSGKLIGFLNDCGIDREQRLCELGYAFHPDHWRQGYASEALKTVLEELSRTGMKTVRAFYFEENPASGRVMEKCGMKPNGLFHETDYRGKIHHSIGMEIGF